MANILLSLFMSWRMRQTCVRLPFCKSSRLIYSMGTLSYGLTCYRQYAMSMLKNARTSFKDTVRPLSRYSVSRSEPSAFFASSSRSKTQPLLRSLLSGSYAYVTIRLVSLRRTSRTRLCSADKPSKLLLVMSKSSRLASAALILENSFVL